MKQQPNFAPKMQLLIIKCLIKYHAKKNHLIEYETTTKFWWILHARLLSTSTSLYGFLIGFLRLSVWCSSNKSTWPSLSLANLSRAPPRSLSSPLLSICCILKTLTRFRRPPMKNRMLPKSPNQAQLLSYVEKEPLTYTKFDTDCQTH